ncbi:hypothetical protein CROQUDRAFT_99382 [Cronartium quercuum f. sp. fusiforme G11]|uniref:Uncharacterized protein n=1 Tax=Cronartium quercuum f. sp. fusiforme G11 TaxID=708437 RepID=A0A9P6N8I0_9BASI|nr:hypothetical protein CROQUDRAFT_99382 [Cronartium quercuum f. sp. fusiforme G11]
MYLNTDENHERLVGSPPQQHGFQEEIMLDAQLNPKPSASTSSTPSLYPGFNHLHFPVKLLQPLGFPVKPVESSCYQQAKNNNSINNKIIKTEEDQGT